MQVHDLYCHHLNTETFVKKKKTNNNNNIEQLSLENSRQK